MNKPIVSPVTISVSEQRYLLEISHLLLCLSLAAQGAAQPGSVDKALQRLQQLQPLIAQCTPPAHAAEAALLKETLGFFAAKKQMSLVGVARAVRGCTLLAHFFQDLLAQTWRPAANETPALLQKTLH